MAKRKRSTTSRGGSKTGVELATLLSILSGEVRRIILFELAREPREVTGLALVADAEISVVSHSLRHLREAGLVTQTPVSRRRIYALTDAVEITRHGAKFTMTIRATKGESVTLVVRR